MYRANELVFVRPYKLDGKMREVGETIKKDESGNFPIKLNFIRYLFRRRIIEPAGSNFAKFCLWKAEKAKQVELTEEEKAVLAEIEAAEREGAELKQKELGDSNSQQTLLTDTDTEKTRRDELLEIAEMEGLKVDGRWSDDRLEDEINALSEADNGQS